ncbi:hypothetical protein OPT61_g3113 [Boeremia exigua]|uniref:Uncharacterized protein n=1 Tax=Boeremia exigua TaxID=749465 RepID=A0ACC2IJ01_9PLEO|nr:hypothetical protein OPT61_g3113 [Boeremia exigua]
MVTLDVQGTFDALLKNCLLHQIARQGWPQRTIRFIDSFLTDQRVQVRLDQVTTPSYPVACSTPQGSLLSPVLYTLYLAELLSMDTKQRFGYADNICLYRASHSIDTNVELLAADLRQIKAWGEANKVAFAPEKQEMIHLTRQRSSYAPPCLSAGTEAEPNRYAYLNLAGQRKLAPHLRTIDSDHPLTSRIAIPKVKCGKGVGQPQQVQTRVQHIGSLLPEILRIALTAPHYSPSCQADPTLSVDKKTAARTFKECIRRIWLCIDSTSVIWCLRGDAPPTSQWAFLECYRAMETHNVSIKWAPGHLGIEGNEAADRLANLEAQDPSPPTRKATMPTLSGIKSIARESLRSTQRIWWSDKKTKLSK